MIKQGTTAWVNFYVATVDGIAASDVVGHITPYIRQQDVNNSVVSNTVVANITSVGNDAPGWYHFSYYFSSSGNVFITFSVNNPPSMYLVMPWEEYVIPMNVNVDTNAIASGVWGYGNASSRTVGGIPTTSAIAASVWTYSTQGNPSSDRSLTYYPAVPNDYAKPGDEMALTAAAVTSVQTGLAKTTDIPTVPSTGAIATSVWGYPIGNPAASASTYLGSIGTIPHDVWTYSTTGNPSSDRSLTYYPVFPTVASIQSGLATTANITSLWDSTKSSISALQTHGDTSWKTATGFATATSLGSVWTSVAGSISVLQTHGDTSWKTATGFATTGNITTIWNSTSASISALQAHGDTSWKTATGFATDTYLSSVWNSTSTSISNLQTHGDQAWVGEGGGGLTASDVWTYTSRSLTTATLNTTNNPVLATLDNITSLWGSTSSSISALQTHGDTSWKTATGFATPTDITTKLTAYSAAKNTDITALYNSISNSLDGGMSAADVWDYAINGSSASVYLGYISTISTSTSNIITSIGTINTAIGSVNTVLGSVNTDIGTIGDDISSINNSLATVTGTIGTVATAVNSNNAALLNWNLSTASILALHVDNTTTTYSITRDLAGNITGVSPNN